MSSMLKKKGGLSFKPKFAQRRNPPPPSTSTPNNAPAASPSSTAPAVDSPAINGPETHQPKQPQQQEPLLQPQEKSAQPSPSHGTSTRPFGLRVADLLTPESAKPQPVRIDSASTPVVASGISRDISQPRRQSEEHIVRKRNLGGAEAHQNVEVEATRNATVIGSGGTSSTDRPNVASSTRKSTKTKKSSTTPVPIPHPGGSETIQTSAQQPPPVPVPVPLPSPAGTIPPPSDSRAHAPHPALPRLRPSNDCDGSNTTQPNPLQPESHDSTQGPAPTVEATSAHETHQSGRQLSPPVEEMLPATVISKPTTKRGRERKEPAAEQPGDGQTAPKKRPRKRKPTSTRHESGGRDVVNARGSDAPKKSVRRRRTIRPKKNNIDGDQGEGENQSHGEEHEETTRDAAPQRRSRYHHRSQTPENAEDIEVDPAKLTMADLTKDLRIGKKFSLHDELLQREREKRQNQTLQRIAKKMGISVDELKARRAAAEAELNTLSNENQDPSAAPATTEQGPPTNDNSTAPSVRNASGANSLAALAIPSVPADTTGPQFQIIDGQIVVDSRSLQVDRQARDAADMGELEEEIEHDFSRQVTSRTYLPESRRAGGNVWSAIETDRFYRGLAMFGTDFMMISRMFPDKTRRQVKQKFNREERACSARVTAALVGEKTVEVDMEEYQRHTGEDYQEVGEIEAEQRRVEEDFEAEQRRVEEAAAEEARKKRDALFANDEGEEGGEGEDEERAARRARVRGLKGRRKVNHNNTSAGPWG